MDVKDQRLEIRISQQQMNELDGIIDAAEGHSKPSRSDVARTFIGEGIDRHYGRNRKTSDVLSLGERLNIYFQILQAEQSENTGKLNPLNTDNHTYENPSSIREDILVRQVYLYRMSWFFKLDRTGLMSVHPGLQTATIASLMDEEPDEEICRELAHVTELRALFRNISRLLDMARKSDDAETQSKLAVIEHQSQRKSVPLSFKGFPESQTRRVQMAAVLAWLEKGKITRHVWFRDGTCSEDLNYRYDAMLDVYQDLTREGHEFDLDSLITLLEDRRLDFLMS